MATTAKKKPATASKSAATAKPAAKSPAATKAPTPRRASTSKPHQAAQRPKPASRPRKTKVDEHVERVWELAERIGICMFVTWDGERQRARPLLAHFDRGANALFFLVDVDGKKDDQIAKFPTVSMTFADVKHTKYVAITGKAEVVNDRARIKALWTPWAQAWWDTPEDPNIRVLRVTPEDAELWDSPGRIASTVAMLTAAITRKTPKLMDSAKVAL